MSGTELPSVGEMLAAISSRWGDGFGLRTDEHVQCFVTPDQHGRWQLLVMIGLPVRAAGMYSLPDRGGLRPSLDAFLEDMGNERI